MIDDEENLLRLVWDSRDFDQKTGKLKGTAFSQRDLLPTLDSDGNPRYLSMDRSSIVNVASVDWRIERATADGAGVKQKRLTAKFAEFNCGTLRALRNEAGEAFFEVIEAALQENADAPGSPENLAHVGVRSLTPCPDTEEDRDLKVLELRNRLKAAFKAMHLYEDICGPLNAAKGS
jgi:hypothetical protein